MNFSPLIAVCIWNESWAIRAWNFAWQCFQLLILAALTVWAAICIDYLIQYVCESLASYEEYECQSVNFGYAYAALLGLSTISLTY